MAEKIIEKIEVVIAKDLSTGQFGSMLTASCYSPDLDANFGIQLPINGAEGFLSNAMDALKTHLADDGKHVVSERTPPETVEAEAEE